MEDIILKDKTGDKNILKEYTAKVDQLNTASEDLITNNLVPVIHGEKTYTVENWLFRSDHATDFGQTVPLIKMLQL